MARPERTRHAYSAGLKHMPKLLLEDRLQKCLDRALNDAILDRGNAQGPELPRFAGLGDKLAPRRARPVCAGAQFSLKPFEEALLTDPIPDASPRSSRPSQPWSASVEGYARRYAAHAD